MIRDLKNLLDTRKLSISELLAEYRKKINQSHTNSFITVLEDTAGSEYNGDKSLSGIPIAIKDNICTKGIRTTCASKMLENFVPDYNAEVTDRLLNNGGIILGKTNMDEFAMGNTSENSVFGAVKNPLDMSLVAGGSSGGSAAAVAEGLAPVALGSDTGGSVRQPAAFCGVLGLKPTYGRISRFGLVAFASSLDQIGIFSKHTDDVKIILDVISGCDAKDSTTKEGRFDFKNTKKIGLPREFFEGCSPEIADCVLKTAKIYEKYGYTLKECSVPNVKYALSAYYIISSAEAYSNLSRFDGIKYGYRAEGNSFSEIIENSRDEGFSDEVKRRLEIGSYVLSHGFYNKYYIKARAAASKIKNEMSELFEEFDFLITPTVPHMPPRLGAKLAPVEGYREDILTVPQNLAGLPALSVPCKKHIGLSITGNFFSEEKILDFAEILEKEGVF